MILNIPPGTYMLTASAVGYAKKTIAGVQVSIDLTAKVDFAVSPTVIEKEEVVVTAERAAIRKDLTSAEARVTAGKIAKLAVPEVGEVLTLQAGVTEDRGGGIHIRGGLRQGHRSLWFSIMLGQCSA